MTEPDRDQPENGGIEPLLSIEDVAGVLRISESGVYRLIRRDEISCVKVGGRTLFEPGELRTFIAAKRQGGSTSPIRTHPHEARQHEIRRQGGCARERWPRFSNSARDGQG